MKFEGKREESERVKRINQWIRKERKLIKTKKDLKIEDKEMSIHVMYTPSVFLINVLISFITMPDDFNSFFYQSIASVNNTKSNNGLL